MRMLPPSVVLFLSFYVPPSCYPSVEIGSSVWTALIPFSPCHQFPERRSSHPSYRRRFVHLLRSLRLLRPVVFDFFIKGRRRSLSSFPFSFVLWKKTLTLQLRITRHFDLVELPPPLPPLLFSSHRGFDYAPSFPPYFFPLTLEIISRSSFFKTGSDQPPLVFPPVSLLSLGDGLFSFTDCSRTTRCLPLPFVSHRPISCLLPLL